MPGGGGDNKGDLFLVVLLVLLCELWIHVILNFPGEGIRKWKKEFSFHGNSLCSNPQAMYKLAMLQVCFNQSLSVAFIQRTRSIIIYAPPWSNIEKKQLMRRAKGSQDIIWVDNIYNRSISMSFNHIHSKSIYLLSSYEEQVYRVWG